MRATTIALTVLLSFALMSCASLDKQVALEQELDGFIGKNVEEVYSYEPPYAGYTKHAQGSLYGWSCDQVEDEDNMHACSWRTRIVTNRLQITDVLFHTDANGVIKSYEFENTWAD